MKLVFKLFQKVPLAKIAIVGDIVLVMGFRPNTLVRSGSRTRVVCNMLAVVAAFFVLGHESRAQVVASDVASNYTGVSTGTNGGTGFGPWTVISGLPNPSFGMYANPQNVNAGVIASRSFSNALSVGQTFSLRWAVNWDADTGSKGFRLFSGGANGTQLAHVLQNFFPGEIKFQSAANGTTNTVISTGGNGPMTWTFTMSNATTLRVTSTARNGTTNVVFTTNLTVSAAPDAIQFYATNMYATPPTVTLSANQRLIAIPVGGTYTADAGRIATDDIDGAIPLNSITNNASTILNLNPEGGVGAAADTYTVTYSATDAAGNTGTATQTVVVHPVGTFASQYSSVAAPGLFNGWAADGSRQNRFYKYENFKWRLLYYFDAAQTSEYLVTANGGYDPKWGVNGVRGAGNANLSPTVNTNGWYVFELNELTDSASLAKLAATPDGDNDLIPDVWESFFGGQLDSPLTDLVPGTIYNDTVGGTKTAKQAYDTGDNPVADSIPPTINLASGVAKFTVVATNSPVSLSDADAVASDNITASTNLVRQIKVDGAVFDPANDTFNTTTNALRLVTYEVFDQANNPASVDRVIAVGDPEPNYRKMQGPSTNTITTISSATIYGRIYIIGATPGAGQVPNITAELGVNSERGYGGPPPLMPVSRMGMTSIRPRSTDRP